MTKILTKLTARGARLDGAGRGTSTDEITPGDVAAALAIATRNGDRWINNHCQYHALLIRYCDHWPNREETEIVLNEIQQMIVEAQTRSQGKFKIKADKIRPIAEAVWAETTGRGMTQRQLAAMVGMSQKWWDDAAKYVFSDVREQIEGQCSHGVSEVRRQLF